MTLNPVNSLKYSQISRLRTNEKSHKIMGLFSDIFHMNLGKYFKPNSTNNWNSLKNSKKKPQNLLHLVNKINSFDIEIVQLRWN